MNANMMFFSGLIVLGTFISSVAQVMLKKAALRSYDSKIKEYLNSLVIVAYMIFFGATLLGVLAYKVVPLSMGPVLEASGYIFITVFGVVIFNEKINFEKALALSLIIVGIVVYSLT